MNSNYLLVSEVLDSKKMATHLFPHLAVYEKQKHSII